MNWQLNVELRRRRSGADVSGMLADLGALANYDMRAAEMVTDGGNFVSLADSISGKSLTKVGSGEIAVGSISGRQTLILPGTNRLVTEAMNTTASMTIFVIARALAVTDALEPLLSLETASYNPQLDAGESGYFSGRANFPAAWGSGSSPAGLDRGDLALWALEFKASTGQCKVYRNGVLLTTGTGYVGGVEVDSPISIGGRALDDHFLNCEVGQVVVTPYSHDARRQAIEGLLVHSWGIQDRLDSGHIYKGSAPSDVSFLTNLSIIPGLSSVPTGIYHVDYNCRVSRSTGQVIFVKNQVPGGADLKAMDSEGFDINATLSKPEINLGIAFSNDILGFARQGDLHDEATGQVSLLFGCQHDVTTAQEILGGMFSNNQDNKYLYFSTRTGAGYQASLQLSGGGNFSIVSNTRDASQTFHCFSGGISGDAFQHSYFNLATGYKNDLTDNDNTPFGAGSNPYDYVTIGNLFRAATTGIKWAAGNNNMVLRSLISFEDNLLADDLETAANFYNTNL